MGKVDAVDELREHGGNCNDDGKDVWRGGCSCGSGLLVYIPGDNSTDDAGEKELDQSEDENQQVGGGQGLDFDEVEGNHDGAESAGGKLDFRSVGWRRKRVGVGLGESGKPDERRLVREYEGVQGG